MTTETTPAQLARDVLAFGGTLDTRWAGGRGEVIAVEPNGTEAAVIETFPTEIQARLWAAQFRIEKPRWSRLIGVLSAVAMLVILAQALKARSW